MRIAVVSCFRPLPRYTTSAPDSLAFMMLLFRASCGSCVFAPRYIVVKFTTNIFIHAYADIHVRQKLCSGFDRLVSGREMHKQSKGRDRYANKDNYMA